MRIAVAGGNGTAGRAVVRAAVDRGHDVVVIGRTPPDGPRPGTTFARVDVTSGQGLAAALEGVDVTVDATNVTSFRRSALRATFVGGTRHLVDTGRAAGIRRHVLLSIVGIDRVRMPYYQAKLAQEEAARSGPLSVTVVRATQFHDFSAQLLGVTRIGPVAMIPALPVQTVDTRDVASVVLAATEAPDAASLLQIGGPSRSDLPDLVRRLCRARGERVRIIPVRVPGKPGKAARAGALTLPEGPLGTITFDTWLAERT